MGFEVDTAEVKKVAREIKAIANDVRQLSSGNVSQMKSNVEENLHGETAEAIKQVLDDLAADIKKIGGGLDAVEKALQEYVKRIEEADRKAENVIRG